MYVPVSVHLPLSRYTNNGFSVYTSFWKVPHQILNPGKFCGGGENEERAGKGGLSAITLQISVLFETFMAKLYINTFCLVT